jgi:hypothetical protein
LFCPICDFLSADVGAVSGFLAVETLIVSHEFCAFLVVVSLSWANFIDYGCVDVHGISSLVGGAASSSSFVALVLFYSKGLIEAGACIRTVRPSLLPLAMLFLGFFGPFFEGPGYKGVVAVGGDDGVEES